MTSTVTWCMLAGITLGLDDGPPYLTQRPCPGDRRIGGRRNGVIFESRSLEFDRIVGPKPRATALVTGNAMALSAHEGAVFLEKGSETAPAAQLWFTTKPHLVQDGDRKVAEIKRLVVDGPDAPRLDTIFESENLVNGATLGRDGRVYFCFQGGLAEGGKYLPSGIFSVDPWNTSDITTVTDAWVNGSDGGEPLYYNSPNDVVVDKAGGVWFSDPSYAFYQGLVPNRSLGDWVWRVDPSGAVAVAADGFMKPNGLVLSRDERTLYVTDTGYATGVGSETDPAGPRSVYAFDVVAKHRLANRRLLYVADTGIPDGIKLDKAGRLYLGCGDGVHVLSRHGELLGKIKLPGKDAVANFAFGKGKWRSTLYVLDETSVTAVELPGTQGAPVGKELGPPVVRVEL